MRKIIAITRVTLDASCNQQEPSNDPHHHRL